MGKRWIWLLIAILIWSILPVSVQADSNGAGAAQGANERHTYLLLYRGDPSQFPGGRKLEGNGKRFDKLKLGRHSLTPAEVAELRNEPFVAAIEEDRPVKHLTGEAAGTATWPNQTIGAPGLHAAGVNGTGVKIAVLDTGIATDVGISVTGGVSVISNAWTDDNGHGTGVAALIGGAPGLVGVAPEARLYAVKVLDRNGSGFVSDVIEGINWALDQGMQIAVMAFGMDEDSQALASAVQAAAAQGVLVVAAAGNTGGRTMAPARYEPALAVGSVNERLEISSFSANDEHVTLFAPGENITTLAPGGRTATANGTSYAAAYGAGAAALVWSNHPSYTADQVRYAMRNGTIRLADGAPAGKSGLSAFAANFSDVPAAQQPVDGGPVTYQPSDKTALVQVQATIVTPTSLSVYWGNTGTVSWYYQDQPHAAWVTVTGPWNFDPMYYGSAWGGSFSWTPSKSNPAGTYTVKIAPVDAQQWSGSASFEVKADYSPPTISVAKNRNPSSYNWFNGDVTLTFSFSDSQSGLFSYSPTSPVTVSTEGTQTVTANAWDRAENAGSLPVSVSIDKKPPTITASRSPLANAAGWSNTNVTVSFACSDALSGIATCPPAVTLTQEGSSLSASGTAVDKAGNTAPASMTGIKIDKTVPTLTASRSPAANAYGWNNSNVTVSFTCSDTLSGVPNCPPSVTVSSEGAGQVASAALTDAAGNPAQVILSNISIDKTAPSIWGSADRSPNANGWYNSDVTVTFSCSDSLSGISGCTGQVPVRTEGANQSVSGAASDKAGNSSPAGVGGISIDKTAPAILAATDRNPNAYGWYSDAVTVSFTCSDNLSGVVGGCPGPAYLTTQGRNQGASATISDRAGNTATGSVSGLNLDWTAPATTATVGNTPVNGMLPVTLQATDNLSGVRVTYYRVNGGAVQTGSTLSVPAGGSNTLEFWSEDYAGKTEVSHTMTIQFDTMPPTIAGAPDRAANAEGWYNADVTVSFTCSDSASGIKDCAKDATLGEGKEQSVTGTAVDNAGNTASATVSHINIDKTAPTIAGAPDRAANADGWYNADVTIAFTCADALSGVAACEKAAILTEGKDQSVTGTASDKAGNTATATIEHVSIDKTAPETAISAPVDWQNADIALTLTATDNLSGVAATFYRIDGGPEQQGSGFTIPTEGRHQVEFWSTDAAGNAGRAQQVTVQLDKRSPTISGAADRAANGEGWYSADVTVSFTCTDTESGMADCTKPVTLGEGKDQSVTGTAKDNAGNTASATVDHLNIDKTAPTIQGAPDRAANADGWYNADVTVTFTCADALSGVADCAKSSTLAEGKDQSVTGAATDKAGNTASATVSPLNVDKTSPEITGAPDRTPNGAGWYNADVSVAFTCTDALSGIAACEKVATLAEGKDQSVTGTAADKAGNTASATVTKITIDKTAPQTSATAPAGWQGKDVAVSLTATDNLSGVAVTYYRIDGAAQQTGTSFTLSADGSHVVEFWSVDMAGNAEPVQTLAVQVDKSAPTITGAPDRAANAEGWYNADVTVSFTCSDIASGIKDCAKDTTLGEGKEQSVTGTAVDNAGNTASATVSHINIDKTAPAIQGAPDRAANADGWYNADVTIAFTCADALSGVAACEKAAILTEGKDQSVTGTASDMAGNIATATIEHVSIDKTAPETAISAPADWQNADIALTLTATDNLSGVAATFYRIDGGPEQQGSGFTIPTEGRHQVEFWSTDAAGNAETAQQVTVQLDKRSPTISGAPDRAANADGWYNADVTVSFTCTDTGSGVKNCTHPATLGEGKDQSVTGTATDNAGNTASTTVGPINIDKTAPTISGAPDRAANADGWYSADVTVKFTCDDALSGVAECAKESTLGEGKDQTATGTAADKAGNTASATVGPINIDKTAPTISGAPDRAANGAGWYNADVTVTFTCTDAPSGVKDCTAPAMLGEGKDQSVTGTATDLAGNTASATVSHIDIDTTAPTISSAPDRPANADGWYSADVTVKFACDDTLSGMEDCTGPTTLGEGKDQTATGIATDNAGNTASATVGPINIDKSAPTISGAPDRTPNAASWYNADVTVSFTCTDASSGVKDCTGPATLGEGKGQSVTGTATDLAGNTASATVGPIDIDKTAPTISGATDRAPNAAGWYNADVTVKFSCDDTLSGVKDCAKESTLGEGKDQTATGTATDNADNTATTTVGPIDIDKTAPQTTIAAPADWQNADIALTLTATDNLSGVAATYYGIDGGAQQSGTSFTVTAEGAHQVEFWSVDAAGNTEPVQKVTVQLDKTAPTISGAPDRAANGAGWYNTDVTVSFVCQDTPSGVKDCTQPATLGEGKDQSVTGTATDNAGNSASTTVGPINIDKTAPNINGAPDRAANTEGWYSADVTVQFSCDDALSGVKECAKESTLGEGKDQSATGTAADIADNTASATVGPINIDKTAPTITGAPDRAANGASWYNADVTVTFTCTDAPSGVKDCTAPALLGEGKDQSVNGTATDLAGHTASTTVGPISIDKTAPTISGAPDRAANADGWYSADVTVKFSCDDTLAGVKDCTGPATLGEGKDQTATGTATDNADNTASATVGPINIDKTAPTITGAPDRAANGFGWYNADVTVTFTCTDAPSGVKDCTGPATLSEGKDQSATGTAKDLAGNAASATVSHINIDETPPTISGAPDRAPNAAGWYKAGVTVSFVCKDTLSGIADCTSPTPLSEGADQSVTGTATDKADNTASFTVSGLNIDTTPPETTAAANEAWTNQAVTVTLSASDNLSGVAGTYYRLDGGAQQSGVSLTVDTAGIHKIDFWSVDAAGNTEAAVQITVQIDRTAPVISGQPDRAANGANWYNAEVTVTFTCTDAASGIASCPAPATLGEGADQSVTGTATDNAGNSASATVGHINIDMTPPVISGAPDREPNAAGWYKAPVTVSFNCSDALSGIAACGKQVTLPEGADQSATGTATDKAGNTASATVDGIKIDMTDPVTEASAPADWQNTDVTVSLTPSDNLSGVAGTFYRIDGGSQESGTSITISGEGIHTIEFWSTDAAGNTEGARKVTVRLDKTAPTITGAPDRAANDAGWYRENVKVTFTCKDALSGIADCTDPVILEEGAGQSVTGTATDKAGNTASTTVNGINIDKTPPVITFSGNQGTYSADETVSITCAATDELSGLASDTCKEVNAPAYALGAGEHSYTVKATDVAGNTGSEILSFTVVVTGDSLRHLITLFCEDEGIANSLITKVDAAEQANEQARAGALKALTNELRAQSGKALTAEEASTLIKLVGAL